MDYKEKLNKIVKKDVMELTYDDKLFLQSRRYYLTGKQKEKFETVLNETLVEPVKPIPSDFVSYKDVQSKAKALGIRYVGVSKEALQVAISTIEGPEGSLKPE